MRALSFNQYLSTFVGWSQLSFLRRSTKPYAVSQSLVDAFSSSRNPANQSLRLDFPRARAVIADAISARDASLSRGPGVAIARRHPHRALVVVGRAKTEPARRSIIFIIILAPPATRRAFDRTHRAHVQAFTLRRDLFHVRRSRLGARGVVLNAARDESR